MDRQFFYAIQRTATKLCSYQNLNKVSESFTDRLADSLPTEMGQSGGHDPKIPIVCLIQRFPSMLRRCWLGDRKGIRPVTNWLLVCWW